MNTKLNRMNTKLNPIKRLLGTLLVVLALSPASSRAWAGEIAIKNGENLAFMGDSITASGYSNLGGYVNLVILGLEANGVKAAAVPAGVGGNKSPQMLDRLDKDVISKKPQWMTLSCGVNDVWHGANGVPLDEYQTNIGAILDKCKQAGIKVMILTPTMIGENPPDNDNNKKLAQYIDFLRATAQDRNLLLADLHADMQEAVEARAAATGVKPGWLLTIDGVHMNPIGDEMMASGVLKAFGLDETQMQKARDAWAKLPVVTSVNTNIPISMQQFLKLSELAGKQGKPVGGFLGPELSKELDELIKKHERIMQ